MTLPFDPLIRRGVFTGLLGFIFSGPVAVLIVMAFRPQPEWDTVAIFVGHYHPLQNLPYVLGFALLAGMVILSIGHFLNRAKPYRHIWLQGLFLTGWIVVQLVMIRQFYFLHVLYGSMGVFFLCTGYMLRKHHS